jgi:hypothetical protein
MEHCFAFVYAAMNFYVLQNEGNFMVSREISAFQEALCTVEAFIYLYAV